jgi:hypothetical protein
MPFKGCRKHPSQIAANFSAALSGEEYREVVALANLAYKVCSLGA